MILYVYSKSTEILQLIQDPKHLSYYIILYVYIYIYLCMYTYFKQDKQQSTSKIFQKPIWLWHFPPLTTINPSSHWSSAAGPGLSPAAGHLQWAEPGAGQPRCWVSSYDMCRTHANGDTVYNIILYIYIRYNIIIYNIYKIHIYMY